MPRKPDPLKVAYKFVGSGLTETEKIWGEQRFKEYRESYPHLNKRGTLQLLEDLVWREALQEKLKQQICDTDVENKRKIAAGEKNVKNEISKPVQDSINDGLQQIVDLRTKLGMFEDQKVSDAFKAFQLMREKASEYRRAHPLLFKTTCPFCARGYGLKRRTTHFEEFISPFLEDKILNNRPLFALYKEGKLTKEDVAAVLGVSPKYVDWLDEKVFGNKVKAVAVTLDTPTSDDTPAVIPAPEQSPEPPPEQA